MVNVLPTKPFVEVGGTNLFVTHVRTKRLPEFERTVCHYDDGRLITRYGYVTNIGLGLYSICPLCKAIYYYVKEQDLK